MPIYVGRPESNFSAAPEGLHRAVCVDVVDLGVQETNYGPKHKIELRWQLADIDPKSNPPRRYLVTCRYTASLHEKATLRHHLEAWRGKKFTADEADRFDVEQLIGVNCQLQLVHNVKTEGKVYANIQAIVAAPRDSQKLTVENYVRVQDRDPDGGAALGDAQWDDGSTPF